ncbi:MAG: NADH-quinone oxidoreductase subunit NuoF [Vicinamibacteria bacterium]|nr:NADH-quinone oxidoreductase subunit NuoF [Vicinamibacteria bacterium]
MTKTVEYKPENLALFERIRARYPEKRSALLPALHLLQDQEGHISREGVEYVAALVGVTPAQAHDAASFYTMFRFTPSGRRRIEICTNLSCALRGADDLYAGVCNKLGLEGDGISSAGDHAVSSAECLAACGGAPALQVNGAWVENVQKGEIEDVLAGRLSRRPLKWPRSPGEPILLRNVFKKDSTSLATYRAGGGYARLRDHLTTPPGEIVEAVKLSNLRGRGGAGFPTGVKWGFLPAGDPRPRYLCVNADEGEPGTFKDRLLIERDPHQLIEGIVASSHAIRARACYVYLRGEFHEACHVLENALDEARGANLVGPNVLGTGVDVEIHLHRGAGSYECGEETALIESLEGKRGQPRLKPPFPAAKGLYDCPTIVNNVETICCVPLILDRGAGWFASYGTERNAGPKLYCVSGHVNRPGVYEAPMGSITLRDLVFGEGYGGGIPGGRRLRAVIPGGSSTPMLTAGEIDVAMDFESLSRAGSALGSAGAIVIDDSTCMVWVAQRLTRFYRRESCGKCTPCREGTAWMLRLLDRIESGKGAPSDLDTLSELCETISGSALCPFGDAAVIPVASTLARFRAEYEYHVREKRCWKEVANTYEDAAGGAGR